MNCDGVPLTHQEPVPQSSSPSLYSFLPLLSNGSSKRHSISIKLNNSKAEAVMNPFPPIGLSKSKVVISRLPKHNSAKSSGNKQLNSEKLIGTTMALRSKENPSKQSELTRIPLEHLSVNICSGTSKVLILRARPKAPSKHTRKSTIGPVQTQKSYERLIRKLLEGYKFGKNSSRATMFSKIYSKVKVPSSLTANKNI